MFKESCISVFLDLVGCSSTNSMMTMLRQGTEGLCFFFLFAGWEQWGGRQMRQGKQKCGSRYVGIQGLREPVNSDSIYIDILHWETNEHHCPPASMLRWVLELGREFVEGGWGWLRLEELRRFWLNAVASKCYSLKLQEEIYLRTKSV